MKKISIALALVSALTLSGCAAGFDAATSAQGNSGNGRTADVGSIQIRNAVIVVDAQTQLNASLVATIINTADEADALKSIEIDPAITPTFSEVVLEKNRAVSVGYNSEISILLTTVGKSLAPSQFIDLTLVFANNESIKMSLLVVSNTDYYSDVKIPLELATPTPTPSAS